jgi:hypothetical protein
MHSNCEPKILDKKIARKALERYYKKYIFHSNCTQLEYGICVLDEEETNNSNFNFDNDYCLKLKRLMEDYHKYRKGLLADVDQDYLKELLELFEEEATTLLEFDCGHFDIENGLYRLCIANKCEVLTYAIYEDKAEDCLECKALKQRSNFKNYK